MTLFRKKLKEYSITNSHNSKFYIQRQTYDMYSQSSFQALTKIEKPLHRTEILSSVTIIHSIYI